LHSCGNPENLREIEEIRRKTKFPAGNPSFQPSAKHSIGKFQNSPGKLKNLQEKDSFLPKSKSSVGKNKKSAGNLKILPGNKNFQLEIQIFSGTRNIPPKISKFSRKIQKSPGKKFSSGKSNLPLGKQKICWKSGNSEGKPRSGDSPVAPGFSRGIRQSRLS